MRKGFLGRIAGSALLVWLPTMASAAGTCTVGATSVAFGTYNPLSSSPSTSTGVITVTCGLVSGFSIGMSYTIALSAGAGSYTQRNLTGTATPLQYNLYSNATMTSVWGDGSAGTSTVSDSYLLAIGNTARNYTVYGKAAASQNVAAGVYADNIIVTVTY